jgi:hypothetical protein
LSQRKRQGRKEEEKLSLRLEDESDRISGWYLSKGNIKPNPGVGSGPGGWIRRRLMGMTRDQSVNLDLIFNAVGRQ